MMETTKLPCFLKIMKMIAFIFYKLILYYSRFNSKFKINSTAKIAKIDSTFKITFLISILRFPFSRIWQTILFHLYKMM